MKPYTAGWHIDDAQATLDDETGKVQLVVNVTATAFGLLYDYHRPIAHVPGDHIGQGLGEAEQSQN